MLEPFRILFLFLLFDGWKGFLILKPIRGSFLIIFTCHSNVKIISTGVLCALLSTTRKIHYVSCPSVDIPFTHHVSTYGCTSTPHVLYVEFLWTSFPRESGSCSRCLVQHSDPNTACNLSTCIIVRAYQIATCIRLDPLTTRCQAPPRSSSVDPRVHLRVDCL